MPTRELEEEARDEAEDWRATTRSSMALSSASASRLTKVFSGSSSEGMSSNNLRCLPHSSSSSMKLDFSESEGDPESRLSFFS